MIDDQVNYFGIFTIIQSILYSRSINVALSDSSVHFHSPLDSTLSTEEFKTLNINKLESNNSSFYMNVEGMHGDFLNVTDFSGKNNIVNVAGSGKESSDGYHLIHAGNSTKDAFKLNGDKVELGSFVYTLEQKMIIGI